MATHARARRIAILGNAGTGKSALATRLGLRAGLPVIHLDRLLWAPGWTLVPEDQFLKTHAQAIAGDRWIIDGIGYLSALDARLEAADTIILLRYPLSRCCWWALKRRLGAHAEGRPEGATEAPLRRLLPAMLRLEREAMPVIEQAVLRLAGSKRVFIVRSPRQLADCELDLG